MVTKPHQAAIYNNHKETGGELSCERMDSIERRLDMVIDFFNIHPDRVPDRVPDRSRKDLKEKAKQAVFRLQNKVKRPGKKVPG